MIAGTLYDVLVLGITQACAYALIGIGFFLIYRNTQSFHFAHGYVMMTGPLLVAGGLSVGSMFGGMAAAVLIGAIVIGGAVNLLYGLVSHRYRQGLGTLVLIAGMGLSFLLQGIINIITNGEPIRLSGYAMFSDPIRILIMGVVTLILPIGAGLAMRSRSRYAQSVWVRSVLDGEARTAWMASLVLGLTLVLGALFLAIGLAGVLGPIASKYMPVASYIRLDSSKLVIILLAFLLFGLTGLGQRTELGLLIRASSSNRRLGTRLGINEGRVTLFVLIYSTAVALACGIALGIRGDSLPIAEGLRWTLLGFLCAAFAMRQGLRAVLVVAFVLGAAEALVRETIHRELLVEPIAFLLLSALLVIRGGELGVEVR